jgi:chaperonin cofactor prefoldin
MTEGWLWTGQYPEAQRILEHGNNQSMELDENLIDAHWTKDNNGRPQFFIINEAIISKLCILGEECEPCFEGAQITKVQFSFEDGFKETLFSMMNELKEMLNEGGTPVFTTYAVEIGDALWSALYDYLIATHPHSENEWSSQYRIEGIYEEGDQKFTILRDNSTGEYFRLNFTISEEGYDFGGELIAVEKEFVPVEEAPQFSLEDYDAFVAQYAESKKSTEEPEEMCPECGKPLAECECKPEGKKNEYILEEIVEYMELSEKFTELENQYRDLENAHNELTSAKEALEAEIKELKEFKLVVERKEKQAMIDDEAFAGLSAVDKEDVITNIDSYSLDDIEAKLSVLCKRNGISFGKEVDTSPAAPSVYHLGTLPADDDTIPAWVKAVLDKQKTM